MQAPRSDQLLNTELTERLFAKRFEVALDLAALNIQRGRDHALPGYTEWRRWCNLTVPRTFDEMRTYVSSNAVIDKSVFVLCNVNCVYFQTAFTVRSSGQCGLVGRWYGGTTPTQRRTRWSNIRLHNRRSVLSHTTWRSLLVCRAA